MKIVISGPAMAMDGDGRQVVDAKVLQSIHGLEYGDEVCATHLDEPLNEIGIEGGSLRIEFDRSDNSLRVVTEYRLPRALTRAEITALVEYTKGQWSDGIGEGCFDDYSKQTGINVSAFPIPYDDDAVQIQVIDDGVLAAKRSPLFSAAKKGDTKRLRALLDKGEDIEAKGQWQHTPLMWALSHQQIEAVLLLISRGANVNYKTKDGATCIRLATMYGNVPVLAALINAGANVNETDERGATPVMWAANRGFLEALQLLLDHGADVDAQDTLQGHTALMYASPNRLDIVEHLLRRGANPRARSKAGLTAHEEALQQAKWEQSRPDRAKLWEKKAQLLATDER